MSINRATISGNVGKDPVVREVNGHKVATFSLATTERGYTRKDGTEVPERTDWHSVVAWSHLANLAEKAIRKGSRLLVEGHIRYSTYDDAQGVKRYRTDIVADNIELFDRKEQSGTYTPPEPYGGHQSQQPQEAERPTQPQAYPAQTQRQPQPQPQG
ncbi:MAG: single-stranded DNA-binding protein, partial [Bacteroidales bacterium]|nr:single-stranded DNA-binding protein [Bacteroidales bacterium]